MTMPRRIMVMITTRTVVAVASLTVAVLIYMLLVKTAPQVHSVDEDRLRAQVAVFEAMRVPVQRQWRGYGTAEAMDSADVPARVTAIVDSIGEVVLAGNPVRKGDLLVTLDDSDFSRQVEINEQRVTELEAQLERWEIERRRLQERRELDAEDVELAQNEVERLESLISRGAANQKDFDRARSELLTARGRLVATEEQFDKLTPDRTGLEAQLAAQRASLRLAQQDLGRTRIASPIDGVLGSVDVEVGEEVRPGDRVARVVNLDRIEVPIRLPASSRAFLSVGDRVVLTGGGKQANRWEARLSRVAPEDDTATRTLTAYAVVEQPGASTGAHARADMLAPGAFLIGSVTSNDSQVRWVVPRRTIRGGRVQLVRDGVVVSRPAQIDYSFEGAMPMFGLPDDQWVVLAEVPEQSTPLGEGVTVVLNASSSLLDGDRVDVVHLPSPEPTNVAEHGDSDAPREVVP